MTKSSSVGHKLKFADRFLKHFCFRKEDVLPGWQPSDDNEEMNLWIDVNTEIADQKRTWVPSVTRKYLN